MKNLINNTLILLSLLFIAAPAAAKEKNTSDTLYVIEVGGKVMVANGENTKSYKIEVLCHNTVVDSMKVTNEDSFHLKIKKNSWYTIRISKEGFYPMNVSINTKLPSWNTDSHKFNFDTELIASDKMIADKDATDFPIAIISYNQKKAAFTPIIDYSLNIKSSLFDIKEINQGYAKVDQTEL